jgi:outer membrane receptor for ferrienterochelin and colicins
MSIKHINIYTRIVCIISLFQLFSMPIFGQEDNTNKMNTEETSENSLKKGDTKSDVVKLNTVVVTATQTKRRLKDSPVSTEIITEKEINESPAESLTQVLETYGIMYGKNAMGSYIYLQGIGGKRIAYLVDGRKITGKIAGRLDADTIPVSNIERIEIIRGPMSSLYGSDAIGGVINIVTKKPSGDYSARVKVTNSFVEHETLEDYFWCQDVQTNTEFGLGKLSGRVTANYTGSDDYYDEDNPYPVLSPSYDSAFGGLDMNYNASNKLNVDFGGSYSYLKSYEAESAQYENIVPTTKTSEYVELEYFFDHNKSMRARVFHNYYLRNSRSHNIVADSYTDSRKTKENEITSELTYNHELTNYNLLTVLAMVNYDRIYKYNLRTNENSDETGGTKCMNTEALAVQDEFFQRGTYSVTLGARAERNSEFGYFMSPKISGLYHLTDNLLVRSGIGVGYRAPDFSDLYLLHGDGVSHPKIIGNPDLVPEKALGENVGLEYERGGINSPVIQNIYFMVNVYRTDLQDEIQEQLVSMDASTGYSEYVYENISESYRMGFDTEMSVGFLHYFSLSGGYNYIYAYNKTTDERMKSVPRHGLRIKFQFNWDAIGFSTYVMYKYTSEMVYVAMGSDEENYSYSVGDRTTLDFYFSQTIGTHMRFFAGISNITDEINTRLGPFVGRKYYAGMEANI